MSPRRFLITGATGGIGRATLQRLLERGDEILAVGRGLEKLDDLAERSERAESEGYGRLARHRADLMDEGARAQLAQVAAKGSGGLDGVVYIAGRNDRMPFDELDEAHVRGVFELNFFAPLLLVRSLVPYLNEGAVLLFVSSTLASKPVPGSAAYSASKAALESLSRSLAIELGGRKVRALSIAPGLVDTAMLREGRSENDLEFFASLSPLGRIGEPDEIASLIVHALDNAFLTGVTITVDGGSLTGMSR